MWMGGFYYIVNIVNSFNYLESSFQPKIFLFYYSENEKTTFENEVTYTKIYYHKIISTIKYNFFERIINKLARFIIKKNIIEKRFKFKLKYVFPYRNEYYLSLIENKIGWIPDFQEFHLPEYFNEKEIKLRKEAHYKLIANCSKLVLSSIDAKNDFDSNYKSNLPVEVINFCVIHNMSNNLDQKFLEISKKYKINKKFFYCPNQFWKHKNHITLFKAIQIVISKGYNPLLVCSGKEEDYRNPDYPNFLKKYIQINNLHDYIKILGFIQREELICLIKKSVCIVQPSLFEGWSTTVEDAKSFNKLILVSDLNVHYEQCKDSAKYFKRLDENDLAEKIIEILNMDNQIIDYNYSKLKKEFALKFINL